MTPCAMSHTPNHKGFSLGGKLDERIQAPAQESQRLRAFPIQASRHKTQNETVGSRAHTSESVGHMQWKMTELNNSLAWTQYYYIVQLFSVSELDSISMRKNMLFGVPAK
jgi:hypothetical protein